MEGNPQYSAVPFSLVGLFLTEGDPESSIRDDVTPEELEKLQELIARFLFKGNVKVVLYPMVVPPEQCEEAVREFEEWIFEEE